MNEENLLISEQKSIYNNFIQFNNEDTYLLSLVKVKPSATTTFLLLVKLMNEFNKVVISKETIINVLELKNQKSAERSINYLIKIKYIFRTERNTYIVNPYICCRTSKAKIQNCDVFPEPPKIPHQFDKLTLIRKSVGEYKLPKRKWILNNYFLKCISIGINTRKVYLFFFFQFLPYGFIEIYKKTVTKLSLVSINNKKGVISKLFLNIQNSNIFLFIINNW